MKTIEKIEKPMVKEKNFYDHITEFTKFSRTEPLVLKVYDSPPKKQHNSVEVLKE